MSEGWERLAAWSGGTVAALAVGRDAQGAQQVYAATPVGVFRSGDAGQSWQAVGAGAVAPFVEAIAVSPNFASDRTLIAGTQVGVYRSRDAGTTWQWVPSARRITSVALDPTEGEASTVLVGTDGEGVWRSADGGSKWNPVNAGLPSLVVLAVAMATDGERRCFLAATEASLARSEDDGQTWTACALPVESPVVQSLAVSPAYARDGHVLAGTEGDGLLRSTDGGRTWSAVEPFAGDGITAIAFDPRGEGRRLAVATSGGVAVSTDGGASWSAVALPHAPALGLAWVEAPDGPVLLAGVPEQGVLRSTDGGRTWAEANAGLHAQIVNGLTAVREADGSLSLFAAITGRGVAVSTDGGATWAPCLAGLDDLGVSSLAASPRFARDRTLFAATPSGLFRSRDGGASWHTAQPGGEPAPVSAVAAALGPDEAVQVVAVSPAGEVAVSPDGGETWEARGQIEAGAGAEITSLGLSPRFGQDRTLYVGTRRAPEDNAPAELNLWRSTDGGVRWTSYLERRGPGALPVTLAEEPGTGGELTVFTAAGGSVLRPMRGARELRRGVDRPMWSSAHVTAEPGVVTALVASPDCLRDATLYAASSTGVSVSRDRGRSFRAWGEGLPGGPVVALTLSPSFAEDRQLWAVGLGGTIWRRRDR